MMSSGMIMCQDDAKNICAGLYAAGTNYGLLLLGDCSVAGDKDYLRINTRHANLQKTAMYKAVWKEITYVDHLGESHTETILVAQ